MNDSDLWTTKILNDVGIKFTPELEEKHFEK
jgi:hypothetical protein